ncbi:SAM-dependent methyltransferase [Thermomonospora umbrina]|uniref:S-adenosyl methyltransferase n=1 Tax=Thermomonospora umbrina TaxID=111806 RepID=A0A3D9SYL3_9ACTN|nr:SAM-dependent methyltransferase [Thermomonospora umbrina]REF00668.1 S-adenosyl methyltransferase [Thermomonospora umbrina]
MPKTPAHRTGGPRDPMPIDTTTPHSARVWNYWLGGKDHYDADRAAGDAVLRVYPDMGVAARQSRAFLTGAVHHLAAEAGVRQFLDIGTGLPTADNTHEIAQRAAPDARIVYVDHDPMVLAHARALLAGTPQGRTDYVDADLHHPQSLLEQASELLDFRHPIALILGGVLGHIGVDPDDSGAAFTDPDGAYAEAHRIVQTLIHALPPWSYLALYEFDQSTPEVVKAGRAYADAGALPYLLRSRDQIAGFFDGLELLRPGLVHPDQWLPDPDPATHIPPTGDGERTPVWCGLAVKS